MEPLLVIAALCILGVLAARFGHDSRSTPRSSEQGFAELGFSWNGRPGEQATAPRRVVRGHPVRHRLAAMLYRVADWLYPGINAAPRVRRGVL